MTQLKATVVTATYRIATPMFCAGANQDTAELRLPSFKGALRFWWRSLMWGEVNDHNELRQREAELFGASDSKMGQSKVRLRFRDPHPGLVIEKDKKLSERRLSGLAYLGYGVMNYRGELGRPAMATGEFEVECRLSRFASADQINEVQRALVLLGTVGGLGSKARKGFGSLTICRLTANGEPVEFSESPVSRLGSLLKDLPDKEPPWSAWSQHSRVVAWTGRDDAVNLLNECGTLLSQFRQWQGAGQSRFAQDHDLMLYYLRDGAQPERPPARIAFGLPHNYFFRSLSDHEQRLNVKAEITPTKSSPGVELTRRGSPMFLHIDQNGSGPPTAVVTFLPAMFLPDPAQVTITDTSSRGRSNRQKKPRTISIPNKQLWKPVADFLDYLRSSTVSNAQEVHLG